MHQDPSVDPQSVEIRHQISGMTQGRELNVRIVLAHRAGIMTDKFLDDGGTDACVLHEAGGRVSKAMKRDTAGGSSSTPARSIRLLSM